MSKLLSYLGWIFFVYSEDERYHVHVYRQGDVLTQSAKFFLVKNGVKDINCVNAGKYRKNIHEISKIIEKNYDYLIDTIKKDWNGESFKMLVVNHKTKRSKK